jgi:prepilin-type N-terminal cleavage/methylation domain-containing protein
MVKGRGFTLIELLVVMVIIGVLVAMLFPAINLIKAQVAKAQTQQLVSTIASALAAAGLDRGSLPPAVPHPLAGSVPARSSFVRGEAVSGYAVGDAVATAGTAVVCQQVSQITGAPATLLLPSDRYSDGAVQPLLFGVRRDELTVLGSPAGLVEYLALPGLSSAYDQSPRDGLLDTPYDTTRYPANRFMVLGGGTLADLDRQSAQVFESALRLADAQELTGRGSLVATTSGTTILGGRLYQGSGPTAAAWQPGLVASSGSWVPYRLRGTALYDRWGRELTYAIDAKGGVRVSSAGPDGVFRWLPGADGTYATAATADTPSGDDRDGSRDNIVSR